MLNHFNKQGDATATASREAFSAILLLKVHVLIISSTVNVSGISSDSGRTY